MDECKYNISDCDVNANCTKTYVSYKCTCKVGYTGDGHSCSCTLNFVIFRHKKRGFPFFMQVPSLMQKHLYAKHLPRIAILKAVCRFFVLLLSTFCSFSIFVAGFFFTFGNFAHRFFVLFNASLSDRD